MNIPRGFKLVFDDLAAGGWSWTAWSRCGHAQGHAPAVVVTALIARGTTVTICALWVDGKWSGGWSRRPVDPVPVEIGALALRPILRSAEAPAWTRPNLNEPRAGSKVPRHDEGTPAHERWSPEIEARVQAGMDRIAHYGRTKEWT